MMAYLKKFLSSRAGWAAVLAHLFAVTYSFWGLVSVKAECGPFATGAGWIYLAGTGLHWAFESFPMQILLIADLPALVLAEIVGNLIGMNSWCFIPRTWTLATLGFLFASVQWFLVGSLLGNLSRRPSETHHVENDA